MAEQAIVRTEKNLPHGEEEGVPSRQTGKENKGFLSPTQDEHTDKRRAKYGEDPAFIINQDNSNPIQDDPNCVESKLQSGEQTVKEFVRRDDVGYGRAMVA